MTLRAALELKFMSSYWRRIADAENTEHHACLNFGSAIHLHRNIQTLYLKSFCTLIFTDTNQYCNLINCTTVLLVYLKWHSALYSKFHFYDCSSLGMLCRAPNQPCSANLKNQTLEQYCWLFFLGGGFPPEYFILLCTAVMTPFYLFSSIRHHFGSRDQT